MPMAFSLPFGDCGRRVLPSSLYDEQRQWGNAHDSKPPPKTATCKGYANVESESEAEARPGPKDGYRLPAKLSRTRLLRGVSVQPGCSATQSRPLIHRVTITAFVPPSPHEARRAPYRPPHLATPSRGWHRHPCRRVRTANAHQC